MDGKSQPPFVVWNEDWRGFVVLVPGYYWMVRSRNSRAICCVSAAVRSVIGGRADDGQGETSSKQIAQVEALCCSCAYRCSLRLVCSALHTGGRSIGEKRSACRGECVNMWIMPQLDWAQRALTGDTAVVCHRSVSHASCTEQQVFAVAAVLGVAQEQVFAMRGCRKRAISKGGGCRQQRLARSSADPEPSNILSALRNVRDARPGCCGW
jgi:hypothetical protein